MWCSLCIDLFPYYSSKCIFLFQFWFISFKFFVNKACWKRISRLTKFWLRDIEAFKLLGPLLWCLPHLMPDNRFFLMGKQLTLWLSLLCLIPLIHLTCQIGHFVSPIFYFRVPRIENRVPTIREIGSLQVHTRCLTFSLKKPALYLTFIYVESSQSINTVVQNFKVQ